MSTKAERKLAFYRLVYEGTVQELQEWQQAIGRVLASCAAPPAMDAAAKLQKLSADDLQIMAQVIGAKPAER